MAKSEIDIAVVGAGVTGLACALLLIESGYRVAIVARDLPTDRTTAFASPWAGALLAPHPEGDEELQRESLRRWAEICKESPASSVKATEITEYYTDRLDYSSIWYRNLYSDCALIAKDHLPKPAQIGFRFTGLTVDPSAFLPWISRLLEAKGVQWTRATLSSLEEAKTLTGAKIVVNASGLGARYLASDPDVMPMRGQTMFVKCDYKRAHILQGSEYTYVIPRIASGGVVLGGVSQLGSTSTAVDKDLKKDILRRVNNLTAGQFKWVDVDRDVQDIVGFRPYRSSGLRVERVDDVVHAYGVAGLGYLCAFGVASKVRDLVGAPAKRAKL